MSISPFAFTAIYFAFTVFFIVVIHAIVERLNRRHDNEQSVLHHRIIGLEADLMELRSELQIARAHSDVLQHQRQRDDEHIIDTETRYVELRSELHQLCHDFDVATRALRDMLWIRYVWNDHNFNIDAILDKANSIAVACGVTSMEHAGNYVNALREGIRGVLQADADLAGETGNEVTAFVGPDEVSNLETPSPLVGSRERDRRWEPAFPPLEPDMEDES